MTAPTNGSLGPRPGGPDTIVLVHGFWVTPRSWEDWKARYEAQGYTVHTPAYPGFEVEVEALRADPTPVRELTARGVVEHLERFLDTLPTTPILIGHSAGGAFVQVLLDHGYGCAGVVLNSAPPEGIRATPPSQLRSVLPVLRNPLHPKAAIGLSPARWQYAFTNTLDDEESRRLYDRYHVPASRRVLLEASLANLRPGHQALWVDFANPRRAPLLLLSGSVDHIQPPSLQAATAARYRGPGTVTEHVVLDGRPHLMGGIAGWEDIADQALAWAVEHASWQPELSRSAR